MLDLKLILDQPDRVAAKLRNKGLADAPALLAPLAGLAERRRAAVAEGDEVRARRNALSKEIGQRKRAGADAADLMAESTAPGDRTAALEATQRECDAAIRDALLRIPSLCDDDVP